MQKSNFENKTINASILQKGSAGEMQKQFFISHLAVLISVENKSRAVSMTVEEALGSPLLPEY